MFIISASSSCLARLPVTCSCHTTSRELESKYKAYLMPHVASVTRDVDVKTSGRDR